jgi:hypothetical protein
MATDVNRSGAAGVGPRLSGAKLIWDVMFHPDGNVEAGLRRASGQSLSVRASMCGRPFDAWV